MTICIGDYKVERNSGNLRKGAVLLFLIVVFAGIFLLGGVRTYPDTDSYLKMSPSREPGYALLLNGVSFLFRENGFFILGILQNALAVFAIYKTAVYIGSKFRQTAIFYAAALCLLMPYVITPFFASSGIIPSNAMISEGITYPLYNLYMLSLLKAVWEEETRQRNLGISLGLSYLLSVTRGQMIVTLIAWLITAVVLFFRKKDWKMTLLAGWLFVCTLLFVIGTKSSYNKLVNGVYTGTTYGDVTILSNVIYVADREDGEAIEDESLRQLFYEIYDIAGSGHMLYQYAPRGFDKEASFYSDMHDDIKDFAIYPTLQSYVEHTEGVTDYMEKSIRVDSLSKSMAMELMPECFGLWISHYIRNVAAGFIRTVAFVHPVMDVLTLLGYLVWIGAGLFVLWKRKESRAATLFLLTMLLTTGNVMAVAMTIMCLSRYMIYNAAFVYISAILLIPELLSLYREAHTANRKETKKWAISN